MLTLAHRGEHVLQVQLGYDSYAVHGNFKFADGSFAVTIDNFDQVWLFGMSRGKFGLSNNEVSVIVKFMNSGGGVFAAGDHADLGRQLCGDLPRIRHMRDWRPVDEGGIPMGSESDASIATLRIDTVSNPGSNNLFEFADQSDDIPQCIYPNYQVTDTGDGFEATVHPLSTQAKESRYLEPIPFKVSSSAVVKC